ncbi:hypothetical protein [Yoonia maritima]|uniref:hypothetical protein n=1 Tax=Yoonia maritima TaxID=1435347 RepID=UPI0037370D5F
MLKTKQIPTAKDQQKKQATYETDTAPLFGDLELLVNELLQGDPDIKRAISKADTGTRGGYRSLQYHMTKAGVTNVSPEHQRILDTLKLDDDFHQSKASDLKNIEHRSPSYRVKLVFEGNTFRKSFSDLSSAQQWRDHMLIMFSETTNLE